MDATGHVQFSRPINIAVVLVIVNLQTTPGFSRIDVQMLIVTLKMMQQALLLAQVVQPMNLCSVLMVLLLSAALRY